MIYKASAAGCCRWLTNMDISCLDRFTVLLKWSSFHISFIGNMIDVYCDASIVN